MTPSENASAWPDLEPTALLVLADGTVLEGFGLGAEGQAVGEVCFNTAMTGYEEILTDPSYAGQLITFTFPHIGNVGTNDEDINAVVAHAKNGRFDLHGLKKEAREWPGLEGMDLVPMVTSSQRYTWDETPWEWDKGFGRQDSPEFNVVAVDYGIKRNILRLLAGEGCKVTVVPATTSAEDILAMKPDGVFLSNGPGDPAAVKHGIDTVANLLG